MITYIALAYLIGGVTTSWAPLSRYLNNPFANAASALIGTALIMLIWPVKWR